MENAEKATALEVIDGTKYYGDAAAIEGMNLTLKAGEIHALLGENGAGKSTISKAIAGAIQLTRGAIHVTGRPMRFHSSADALKAGVAMVFQETSLVPYMTVAQNIVLGNERVAFSQRRMEIEAQEFLASLNFAGIDVTVFASSLGRGHKQIVEIARALYNDAKVIIFDEPTASLSPGETARFFELLEMLKQRGVAIVFISHNLEEALDLADRVSIMRDGKLVATGAASEFSRSSIVSHMVGREDAGKHYTMIGRRAERWTRKHKILSVENLRYSPLVKNMSFSVYEGEITCIAGLVGAGRSEMAKVVAGVYRRDITLGGKIYLNGESVSYRQPISGIRDGIVYLTEDRKIDGIFETMGIEENIYLGHLAMNSKPLAFVSHKVSSAIAKRLIERLKVKSINMRHPVNRLSGGNQQKVVLAKALVQKPKLLIVDEPTRGVDVGAIEEIHSALRELAREGVAVVVISSYLPEVLKLADRVLVARRGQIVAEFASAEATEARIMAAALF
ncbi:sugar ABC transporter ATP-binding protein [Rhizobium sp. NZLR11]|uniref:sugar ABC transporter ATP-binding protein n=1 Tax=Rhizobium sp. NZLR11 TaxID=2731098 RepID=UPI0038F7829E